MPPTAVMVARSLGGLAPKIFRRKIFPPGYLGNEEAPNILGISRP